jgi:hypothetical protein
MNAPWLLSSIHDVEPNEVDRLLTAELNSLSVLDRERATDAVHGVHGPTVERDESTKLDAALRGLDDALRAVPDAPDTAAYREAVRRNSPYVRDVRYRTKFVRAGRYDPTEAARRMVCNLQMAKDLFGDGHNDDAGIMRPVRYEDLTDNARRSLERGAFRLFPFRDSSGRRIVMVLAEYGLDYTARDNVSRSGMFDSCCCLSLCRSFLSLCPFSDRISLF